MANDFPVQNRSQVIVPVRVVRAVSGAPRIDAPDVDHRGWHSPHFSNWTNPDIRGGMFGILHGQTVRVKVAREHLASTAPLFVTAKVPSGGTAQIAIAAPANSGPLPGSGEFRIRGTASSPANGGGNLIEVRLGAANGPLMAECEVRVFGPARLRVIPHVCTIHSTAAPTTNGTAPNIDVAAVFAVAQAIWRQAGVELQVAATQRHNIHSAPLADAAYFRDSSPGSIGWIANQAGLYTAGNLNAYFIRYVERRATSPGFAPLGLGIHRGNAAGLGLPHPGIFIATDGIRRSDGTVWTRETTGAGHTQELGNDTAHEIGHYLTLSHFGNVQGPGRADTYTRRNLMHPNNLLPGPSGTNNVRFHNCGYGTGAGGSGHRGCMITMKQHNLFAAASGASLTALDCQAIMARMQIFQSPGRPVTGVALY